MFNIELALQNFTETQNCLVYKLFMSASEAIMITDPAGVIVDVNESYAKAFGFSRDDSVGRHPRMLQSGLRQQHSYIKLLREVVGEGTWAGETWIRRKNGQISFEAVKVEVVSNAIGKAQNYVVRFKDIGSKKDSSRQLRLEVDCVDLIDPNNRDCLVNRISNAMLQSRVRNRSAAIINLELDGFRSLNEVHGRSVGDKFLIELEKRIHEALHQMVTLSRIAGDEFIAVLIDFGHSEDYIAILKRLLNAVSQPVNIDSTLLHVTASLGVSIFPEDGDEVEMLLRNADHALYVAKHQGGNRYQLFDSVTDLTAKARRNELSRIQRGLISGEFELFYQPKVNMKTGVVVGAEALIRWRHPERGLLAPGMFLPLLEGHPVSQELDEWVIATALNQMSEWNVNRHQLTVSVNIGVRRLQQNDFATSLAAKLAAHPDVSPQLLELEVLETSAMDDILRAAQVMRDCQDLGVRFALDDFGTGYSSLTYLRQLPVEVLKIDNTFVSAMLDSVDDLAIVQSVLGLAKAFGREVVAEGVESKAHGALCISLGCDIGQGYGISRPMPAGSVPSWLHSWNMNAVWASE